MLGFIGTGNMASAIIKGIVSSGTMKGDEIAVFDLAEEKARSLSDLYSARVLSSAKEIAKQCDKIVLSVKPHIIPSVLSEIDETAKEKKPLFISIAAGKTIEFIMNCLSFEGRVVRVMPNINAKVGAAVSAYCGGDNVTEDELDFVKNLCESFGTAVKITENHFSVFSAIAGCSPAYSYMYIDSLARAAVKNGMPKAQALEIAAQAVLGSAKMILSSDEHPWHLVDQVCSPGGTTIEGVASLQSDGFESAVIRAVDASCNKDKKI